MSVKIIARKGTASQIESAASSVQEQSEIAYATDTKDFYVSDGTQFNKIGKDELSQFSEISVVNDVNTWYLSDTNILDLSPPEGNPTGITFKPDGTKMFTIGYSRNRVQMYDLSTAWDITSAGSPTESEYLVQNNLGSTQEDFFIDSSGTRMYVLSRSSDSVGQFTLNTAWDISDITFVQDVHINSTGLSGGVAGFVTGEADPAGITFKPDGTIMYIVGYNQDKVQQIPLSTAWDISTHGTITSISISPANASQGIQFSVNGKDMYILDYGLDGIAHFTLSTAWDVTTANLTGQSVAFIRANEGTPTGLFYREDLGKCFIVGRSSDFAREIIANDVISFNEGITAPVVYAPQVTATRLTTGGGGSNNFYNATYAHTTFQANSTTYLGYATSSPLIRFGNSVQQNTRIQVSRFTYLGTETINDPLRVPRFQFFPSLVGAKSKVYFGQFLEDTANLIGGSMDIESIADTFDHKGEITLGGELKVAGDKPLAYKDPNLYTQGTQIVLDNFTEASDTDLLNHTPDTGSGYTEVFVTSGANNSNDYAKISGGNGYVAPARNNANDGFRFTNDTTISTANYEARAVIKRQHGGDDPFVLFVKYIDEDNYFAMSFTNAYTSCTPISVVNGVYSTHGYMYYHVNTSTADNENIDVALRVVGNNVHLFYEGLYRGSREINITGAGKAGIGFGRMNNSQYTSYDLGQNNHISKFEIYELPDSLFDGSNSVHYIENGKLGIGTTSPTSELEVNGSIEAIGNNAALHLKDSNDDSTKVIFDNLNGNSRIRYYGGNFSFLDQGSTETLTIADSTGNVGIGTTSPAYKLHVSGNAKVQGNIYLNDTTERYIYGYNNSYIKFYDPVNGGIEIGTPYNHTIKIVGRLNVTGDFSTSGGFTMNGDLAIGDGNKLESSSSSISNNIQLYRGSDASMVFQIKHPTVGHYIWLDKDSNELVRFARDGKVGIGTTSPQQLLDIAATSTAPVLRLSRNQNIGGTSWAGESLGDIEFYTNDPSTAAVFGKISVIGGSDSGTPNAGYPDGHMVFYTKGQQGGALSEKLRITDTGNVGIGTATPAYKLHVNGTARFEDAITLSDDVNNRIDADATGLLFKSAAHYTFSKGANTLMFIKETGNVGIGTTSPVGILHAYSTSAPVIESPSNAAMIIRRNDNVGYSSLLKYHSGNSEKFVAGLSDSGDFTDSTGEEYIIGTTKTNPLVVLKNDGKLGIGVTDPERILDVGNTMMVRHATNANRKLVIGWGSMYPLSDTDEFQFLNGGAAISGMRFYGRLHSSAASKGNLFSSTGLMIGKSLTDLPDANTHLTIGGADTDTILLKVRNYSNANIFSVLGSGNVGIGTTSPSEKLDVSGNAKVDKLIGNNANFDIYAQYTNRGRITLHSSSSSADSTVHTSFLTNGSTRMVINRGGDIGIGITLPTEKLDVVGNIKASGTIKGKMEQMFACSFSDDLGTTKHYLSFTSNAEQTNVHADQAAMVMSYGGRVKCIQMRLSNIDGDTTRTFGVETIATGGNMYASSNNWTIEETEAYEITADDDFYLVNYVFSNETHFDSGDLLAISIQDTEDAYTASRQTYVNVIIEYDLNNGMGNDTATTKYTS